MDGGATQWSCLFPSASGIHNNPTQAPRLQRLQFNPMIETQTILDKLKQPLDVKRVQKRDGAGKQKLSYLETHDVIDRMNDIFGYDGWECEVVSFTMIPPAAPPTGFITVVRVAVQFEEKTVSRCGTGWGTVRGGNYELGAKEAESDALKRACRTLGDQFGNSLYEKDAPEHQGQQRARLATTAQLQECEALRQKAVKLGFRAPSGAEPAKQEEGAEERPVVARIAAYRAFIQQHGDKSTDATLPPPDDVQTARFDALEDLGGFSRFLNACSAAQLPFANDADLSAFEKAAAPKTNREFQSEELSDDDWHGWAAMVEQGTLTWGVAS
jgi:hypothetical protein